MIRLRGLLFQNAGLKLLSLFLAFMLWMVVFRGDQSVGQTFTIPVQLVPPPSSLLVRQSAHTIKLQVEGTPSLLRNLPASDLLARVPLPEQRTGDFTVDVEPRHLNLPGGLRVTGLSPSSLRVTVERIEHRRVKILDNLIGDPAPGYHVADVVLRPETVVVQGAESEVNELEGVLTEPIDVSGKKETFLRQVALAQSGTSTILPARNVLVEVRVSIVPDAPPPASGKSEDRPKKVSAANPR